MWFQCVNNTKLNNTKSAQQFVVHLVTPDEPSPGLGVLRTGGRVRVLARTVGSNQSSNKSGTAVVPYGMAGYEPEFWQCGLVFSYSGYGRVCTALGSVPDWRCSAKEPGTSETGIAAPEAVGALCTKP